MRFIVEPVLQANPSALADPIRQSGVMPGDRVSEQAAKLGTKALDGPQRAGTGVIDPLPWTAFDAFEMRVGVARGDHLLELGGVFTKVVPQRRECGHFRRTPGLGKLPCKQRCRAQVLFEVVGGVVVSSPMGDRSEGAFGTARIRGHIEENVLGRFLFLRFSRNEVHPFYGLFEASCRGAAMIGAPIPALVEQLPP
jgi:hypothetical protein